MGEMMMSMLLCRAILVVALLAGTSKSGVAAFSVHRDFHTSVAVSSRGSTRITLSSSQRKKRTTRTASSALFAIDVIGAAKAAADAAASAATAAAAAAEAATAAAEASARLATALAEAAASSTSKPAVAEEKPPAKKSKKKEPVVVADAADIAKPAEEPKKSSGGEVTPKRIKELRDATGAGMMDCKRALLEENGDMEAAAEYLRKKGLAKADKKATRIAAEGRMVLATSDDDHSAVLVEVNCETDFVAKDGGFLDFCGTVADLALKQQPIEAGTVADDLTSFMSSTSTDAGTLEEQRQALVAKIGENIQVRRLAARGSADTTVGAYVHMNRIGVLVELEGGTSEVASDVAMHVAAMNPPFARADQVPADVLDKERRILSEQALDSGKPPEIVEKMVEGRIRKYLEEICCVSQTYVKTNDKTVGKYLEENGASMVGFTRIAVGEGIEKKVDDFAAEVASMAVGK